MQDAKQKITAYIASQDDWKQDKLKAFRSVVQKLQPDATEDWKWNSPIFTVNGKMRLSMAAFKNHVKYNFFVKDTEYTDKDKLFNGGFESINFRSIDLKESDTLDTKKLEQLIAQFLKR